jgi:hypothetical protein
MVVRGVEGIAPKRERKRRIADALDVIEAGIYFSNPPGPSSTWSAAIRQSSKWSSDHSFPFIKLCGGRRPGAPRGTIIEPMPPTLGPNHDCGSPDRLWAPLLAPAVGCRRKPSPFARRLVIGLSADAERR